LQKALRTNGVRELIERRFIHIGAWLIFAGLKCGNRQAERCLGNCSCLIREIGRTTQQGFESATQAFRFFTDHEIYFLYL
jgi:hypothetical protein